MDSSRWQRLQAVFSAATACAPGQRAALIDQTCGDDPQLQHEVETLLAQWQADPDFLEQGPSVSGTLTAEAIADEDALINQRLGVWKVLRRIDRGGMGAVYLAERMDNDFQQLAAIKVVARGMDSEQVLTRFNAERQILASLEHPHIARVLDGGLSADGQPWFAMPYLEGGVALDRYCDAKSLGVTERIRLFQTICTAVHFAHQNLVVHRDLKPANILVTPSGQPMLLDFGIAKLLDGSTGSATQWTERVLTPDYASPEQLFGGMITTASDVYQLGILLFRLLSGARPWPQGADLPTLLRNVTDETAVPRPSTLVTPEAAACRGESEARLRRTLRGDLDTICLRAMDQNPQRRYRSAEAMADDLERHLQGLPVLAQADSFGYHAGKFVRRCRWSVALTVTLIAMVAGFWTFADRTRERLADQAEQLRSERERAEATARFLSDVFVAADPARASLDAAPADVLARGYQVLNGNANLSDRERGAVLNTMGGIYTVNGQYRQAREALLAAVAIGRSQAVPSRVLADGLLGLSRLESRMGNHRQAESQARESLAVIDALHGTDSASRADAVAQLTATRAALAPDRAVMANTDAARPQ